MNFDKSTVGSYYLCIFSMIAKFQGDQRSIVMSSINCINLSFCSFKWCTKDEFMNGMVNNIQLEWELACMFRTYRTCSPTVKFSKYKFINNLLGGVLLLIVTLGVTWT